ncbi:hypothetical protein [Bradyrhizobium sp.]|uniref:hypothetical protein n=1 Tax=Bradyrhizobium sp. TaxID=376 RepID=UPI0023A2F489|nr:hypothetical protein [Bradyrhizobium sp.]MDE2378327.1 hypothetical protein [Bradyrhizobium sp.]
MAGIAAGLRRADCCGAGETTRGSPSCGLRTLRAIGVLPGLVLLLCASLLLALEVPSKPFLDKNSFLMSSAGFRIQVANDAPGKKALNALPPHRFVVHKIGNDVHYLYAEPKQCVCIFIGTEAAYNSYRVMLSRAADQPAGVSADYKTQASALLSGPPTSFYSLNENQTLADYLRKYY